jgi:ABC-type Fe3+ transport system permease subunit
MQIAIAILAGALALLCVVSLVYVYRRQRDLAAVTTDDASPAPRLDS